MELAMLLPFLQKSPNPKCMLSLLLFFHFFSLVSKQNCKTNQFKFQPCVGCRHFVFGAFSRDIPDYCDHMETFSRKSIPDITDWSGTRHRLLRLYGHRALLLQQMILTICPKVLKMFKERHFSALTRVSRAWSKGFFGAESLPPTIRVVETPLLRMITNKNLSKGQNWTKL